MNKQHIAIEAAKKAWADHGIRGQFDKVAFMHAMNAYMTVLSQPDLISNAKAPKSGEPASRSTKEHFLALASGNHPGYVLTPGRTGSIHREFLCFQPDATSSVLLPLFMSVHLVHDPITDMEGRKFDVAIKRN